MNDDLISRQAAIDAFEDTTFTKNEIRRRLSELPSAQPEQRWIPVTERLPGYGEKVLVKFCNKYFDRTTIGVSHCYMQKEGFFSDQPFDYDAVAWQPLPEPYKEV